MSATARALSSAVGNGCLARETTRPRPWDVVVAKLPEGSRWIAWLLWPWRWSVFGEEMRLFGRFPGVARPEGIEWAMDYLSHPRYREASLGRRLGFRCRAHLLQEWAWAMTK